MALSPATRRGLHVTGAALLLLGVALAVAGLLARQDHARLAREGVLTDATVAGTDPCGAACLVRPDRLVVDVPAEGGTVPALVPAGTPYAVGDTVRVRVAPASDGGPLDAQLADDPPAWWTRRFTLAAVALVAGLVTLLAARPRRRRPAAEASD